ncbi:MAG: CRISPR-associated RAMP family protein [Herpetosiphonaceae bacterium]|nr:MAG: CRISPR-associated RAMP family protein [Herpetosiphonaceae bacterium]
MNPKHLEQINIKDASRERIARAPYNFVELPEAVAQAEELPTQDRYHADRLTGRITCRLTTESPLYIRCGLTAQELRQGRQAKDQPDFFYLDPESKEPVIPGSSLRGMLRTLVEIAGFGKIERVISKRLCYRAVGDTTSIGNHYRQRLIKTRDDGVMVPLVQAGYMHKESGQWWIVPAQKSPIDQTTFARIEWSMIPSQLRSSKGSEKAKQIFVVIDPAQEHPHGNGRIKLYYAKVRKAEARAQPRFEEGVLVETGKMPNKHMQFVFRPKDTTADQIKIPEEIILAYQEQLTPAQEDLLGKDGILQEGHPVFYLLEDEKLVFIGHTMMFRLPYKHTPLDFVPSALRRSSDIDLAEAIFGYVRGERQTADQARAGRVFIGDARLDPGQSDWWLHPEPFQPKILGSPKPSTFQHYLTQSSLNQRGLKHYDSKPGEETVIRGHKLYWHKGSVGYKEIADPNAKEDSTQHTTFKPIRPGLTFTFSLSFENLSKVELGVLLWVLRLAADERYRLKLGMGKPLGMGAVKIESQVALSERGERYRGLFDGDRWATGERQAEAQELQDCIDAFARHILGKQAAGERDLYEEPRLKMLLALLWWPGPQPVEEWTRYLEIQRKGPRGGTKSNEYRNRPVLPTPLQVLELAPPPADHHPLRFRPAQGSSRLQQASPATPTLKEGMEVTGQCRGFDDQKTKQWVIVSINGAPSNVIGLIPAQETGGSASGGVRARIVSIKTDSEKIFLKLERVKKNRGQS